MSTLGYTQSISIQVENQDLSAVFYQMRSQYQVEFSFNAEDIEGCVLSKNAIYKNPEEAIIDLLSGFDLDYKKQGSIFIIIPQKKKKKDKPNYHFYYGFIADATAGESLPSALIKYKNGFLSTNSSGYFTFRSTDSVEKVQIQYLGYYTKDTLLTPSQSYQIKLKSADFYLDEVEVKSESSIFDMITGQRAASIKLNQKTSRYLPGNMDNGIYNMLRLQPGIMASGEQTNDYTIWGSWPGQNIMEYDHIRLFSMSSFDENQSIVHPLMIQEINVTKGAFNTDYGNGVGGLVDITGKSGDYSDFHGNANISNQAVSGYLNIPIAGRFSFQTAYRQTFYNILEDNSSNQSIKDGKEYVIPETSFRDFNVKFTGHINDKDHFKMNVITSEDNEYYSYSQVRGNSGVFSAKSDKDKTQSGFSTEYNKFYKNKNSSTSVISYSHLKYNIDINRRFVNTNINGNGQESFEINSITSNQISEIKINHSHQFVLGEKNFISATAEFVRNTNSYENEINLSTIKELENESNRFSLVLKDHIAISKHFYLEAGLRTDYVPEVNEVYVQPRFNMTYSVIEGLKVNAAYGKYVQFLYKSTIYNEKEVLFNFWEILKLDKQEATSAHHYVLGLSYDYDIFNFSVEAFYKSIDHIFNYSIILRDKEISRSSGEAKIKGIDFYLKAKIGQHEIWGAYTLSQTMERFENSKLDEFELAPHHQRHELKGAAILNFSPFYISTNYVYGSGLEFSRSTSSSELIPYNRWDASLMYKLNINTIYCQFGISALNILDYNNIKYSNLIRLSEEELVYSQSTPFTLLLNVYIGF
ncbi:hypothetical protein HNV12_12880 [Methanococcoides sp. SA1]|nr:hypothetical protein [Methanococcoides sp. SA1]